VVVLASLPYPAREVTSSSMSEPVEPRLLRKKSHLILPRQFPRRRSRANLNMRTGLRVTHPNYIAPLNRSHSASQNPVVGSPSDADTLHVLIVVRISKVQDLILC
jgi:hypothetical protein